MLCYPHCHFPFRLLAHLKFINWYLLFNMVIGFVDIRLTSEKEDPTHEATLSWCSVGSPSIHELSLTFLILGVYSPVHWLEIGDLSLKGLCIAMAVAVGLRRRMNSSDLLRK